MAGPRTSELKVGAGLLRTKVTLIGAITAVIF